MQTCIHGEHPCAKGNQHAVGSCPPARRPGWNRRSRKISQRRRNRAGFEQIKRGIAIAGTGKPRGPSK